MSLRVYLLRHGEPADRHLFYGHHDVALSERGHAQVRAQVRWLRHEHLAEVHCSDLSRARIGAEAIAAAHAVPLHETVALREMHLGDLEGVTHRQAAERYPALVGRSYADMLDFRMPGGGESVRDLSDRVLPAVESAVRRLLTDRSKALVIYAHNTVVRVLLAAAAGLGPEGYTRFASGYGSISRVDIHPSRAQSGPWLGSTLAHVNLDPLLYDPTKPA